MRKDLAFGSIAQRKVKPLAHNLVSQASGQLAEETEISLQNRLVKIAVGQSTEDATRRRAGGLQQPRG
jgi:hypothetical protein